MIFRPVREGFWPPPALRAPISGVIDSAARPAVVFHHDQEGIFIARSGHSSRRGKREILKGGIGGVG